MTAILNPQAMQKVLAHGTDYQRALGLLNKNWEPANQPIYRDVLQAADVYFARQLQGAGLINGRVDLNDYRSVNFLLMHHDQWFAEGARAALLAPFQE